MRRDSLSMVSKQDRIDAQIRGQIVTGVYKPGQRLPTWDELEEQFGVSRLTIRRGLAMLHQDGFLTAARSRGTRVVDRPPHLFNYGMAMPYWEHNSARVSRFWRQLVSLASAFAERGPMRFKTYYGFDWGYSGESVAQVAADADAQRVAGVITVSHARHALLHGKPASELGVPVVALTSVPTDPVVPIVGPDVSAFIKRAAAIVRSTGRRRVALLGDFGSRDDGSVHAWEQALGEAGLETRRIWSASVPWQRADWAGVWIETLFRLPPSDRPEALIVDDEHLCAHAVAGLATVVPHGEVPVVSHTNFPVETPAPPGVIRVGFDLPAILLTALRTIDDARAGRAVPPIQLLAPKLESDFAATT